MEKRITEWKELKNIEIEIAIFVKSIDSITVLEHFSERIGLIVDYAGFDFQSGLDDYDDPEGKVDENHVIFYLTTPAVEEDSMIILTSVEFYDYLERAIHERIKLYPDISNNFEVLEKLKLLKKN